MRKLAAIVLFLLVGAVAASAVPVSPIPAPNGVLIHGLTDPVDQATLEQLNAMIEAVIVHLETANRGETAPELQTVEQKHGVPFTHHWWFWVIVVITVIVIIVIILLILFIVFSGDDYSDDYYSGGGWSGSGSGRGGGTSGSN